MSIFKARQNPPPALPPPKQIPGLSNKTNSRWNLSSCQEKDLRWRDVVLPPFMSPTSREHGQSGTCCNANFSYTSTMNPTISNTYMAIDKSHPRIRDPDTVTRSNRFEGEGLSEPSTVVSTRFQVHDKFQTILQAYDKEMLSKLDLRRKSDNRTPPNHTKPIYSASTQDSSPILNVGQKQRTQLRPISVPGLPDKERTCSESFNISSPHNQTLSPLDSRSPFDPRDSDKSMPLNPRLPCNAAQGNGDELNCNNRSYIHPDRILSWEREEENQEETGIRRLNINEYNGRTGYYSPCAATGKKRRACSPIEDDSPSVYAVGNSFDLKRRESIASRNSSGTRFHSHSGSISSTTSDTRKNSHNSSFSIAASSITSMGSLGRLSPGGISPRCMDSGESPCAISQSTDPSPRGTMPRLNYQRRLSSDNRSFAQLAHQLSESVSHSQQSRAVSTLHGAYLCECCPKKPKKFDTIEDLNAHEQEKQYECAYCRNRFKNKNEAERHQNSLHLRRHSWSCAALTGYAAAFHISSTRPSEADTCGYCGEDFPRTGMASGRPIITEHDWNKRITHLTEMHKFGECNLAKKFFRADHFRQHLKHSHAGTSGKWTNMLENACMKDEPLPEPLPDRANLSNSRVSRLNENKEVFPAGEGITRINKPPKFLKVT